MDLLNAHELLKSSNPWYQQLAKKQIEAEEHARWMHECAEQKRKEEWEVEWRHWVAEIQSRPQSYWDSLPPVDDCYL